MTSTVNTELLEKMRERRADKLRMGQATCEVHPLVSDPEVRVALVPLTEAEYDQCLEAAALITVPDNDTGREIRDRREAKEVLCRSLRNPEDISERMFGNTKDMGEVLDIIDINFLRDAYLEMIDRSSPQVDAFTEEEIEQLKKVLLEMPWNELSGKQWYALKRFLLTLTPTQLLGRLLGSLSTNS